MTQTSIPASAAVGWKDYFELCKPKVVALMLLTVLVGMYLASPGWIPFATVFYSVLGIGLTAGSAAAINHTVDKRIDAIMARTRKRPVARGKIESWQALLFAACLGAVGILILMLKVNVLTAFLTFATLLGYAGIYTGFLKRATPQNIVIGGLAGATPPLLGWTAVTGQLSPEPLLLVLIIFTWTPPHFWALAIYRIEDYRQAEIPMLPVTHGIRFTKLQIVLYTVLLVLVSALPFAIGMNSIYYFVGAMLLGGRFLHWAVRLYRSEKQVVAMQTFRYSIVYLMWIFVILLSDHYLIRG